MESTFLTSFLLKSITLRHMRYDRSHFCDGSAGKIHSSFGYIREGSTTIVAGNLVLKLPKGSFFYLPEGIRYRSTWIGSPDIEYIMIHMNADDEKELIFAPSKIEELSNEETGKIIDKLEKEIKGGDTLLAQMTFLKLFSEAKKYLIPKMEEKLPESLIRALEFIQIHYMQNYSMEELSRVSLVSESRLYHLFQVELGTTPVEYRNELRIIHATEYLKEGLKTEEILSRTGFASSIYFREVFKKYYKMTPMQYQKQFQNKDRKGK